MAPIARELKTRGIQFNLIDTGQHAELTTQLSALFNLDTPITTLASNKKNISTILQAFIWSFRLLYQIVFRKSKIYHEIFKARRGICLIHGDTLSTLLSLLYAKRCGNIVAHVEAGLRSFNLLDPFPEEIIRIITMRFSDILFAPSDWAYDNLISMGYGDNAVRIGGNTVIDAIRLTTQGDRDVTLPQAPYVLVTIHRVETIFSRRRLRFIVGLLNDISTYDLIVFVIHDPTMKQLRRFGLYRELEENPNIDTIPLMPYSEFLTYMKSAKYVITDGGSIQEETAYLDVPCILLRKNTERRDGLSRKTLLSGFDRDQIDKFLLGINSLDRNEGMIPQNPSAEIVDRLLLELS